MTNPMQATQEAVAAAQIVASDLEALTDWMETTTVLMDVARGERPSNPVEAGFSTGLAYYVSYFLSRQAANLLDLSERLLDVVDVDSKTPDVVVANTRLFVPNLSSAKIVDNAAPDVVAANAPFDDFPSLVAFAELQAEAKRLREELNTLNITPPFGRVMYASHATVANMATTACNVISVGNVPAAMLVQQYEQAKQTAEQVRVLTDKVLLLTERVPQTTPVPAPSVGSTPPPLEPDPHNGSGGRVVADPPGYTSDFAESDPHSNLVLASDPVQYHCMKPACKAAGCVRGQKCKVVPTASNAADALSSPGFISTGRISTGRITGRITLPPMQTAAMPLPIPTNQFVEQTDGSWFYFGIPNSSPNTAQVQFGGVTIPVSAHLFVAKPTVRMVNGTVYSWAEAQALGINPMQTASKPVPPAPKEVK